MDEKSSMVMVAARIGLGLENLSIAGGLLAVAAAGPGLFSLDGRRAQGAKAEQASWKAVRAS